MKEIIEKTVAELNLDKSDWLLVKFGDIAIQQKQTVDRDNTELTRYVKGEHMYSEDIHLQEWGELTDEYLGPAFIRKFEEGDILYGSRRTYLRKVVLAPFDGITSNTTFVIKANEEKVDKRLLPFIMLSEGFAQHSIKNSKGSVNPYVNWKDLAGYEFLLPSIDEQRKLLDVFEYADQLILKDIYLKERIETLRNTNREKLYTYGIKGLHDSNEISLILSKCGLIRSDITLSRFFDCVEIASGQVDPSSEEYRDLYQIGSERIEANTGRIVELKSAKELGINSGNYLFTENDVIYSKIRPYFKKVANPNFTGLCSADIYPLRPKSDKLLKDFLFYYLLTEKFTRRLLRFQNRTGMPKVNREELGSMYIPLPSKEEQQEIVDILNKIDDLYFNSEKKLDSSKELLHSIINQVF